MKSCISAFLALILCLTALASCANPGEKPGAPTPGASQNDPAAVTDAPTDKPDTDKPTDGGETESAEVSAVRSYMNCLPGYIFDTYTIGDALPDAILTLVFRFCFYNRDVLDFVEGDWEAGSTMTLSGEGVRHTAKLLFGDSFDASAYHALFDRDKVIERYDSASDTYIVPFAKDYWGGELWFTDHETLRFLSGDFVIAETHIDHYPTVPGEKDDTRTLAYTFDVVEEKDVLYPQIRRVVHMDNDYYYAQYLEEVFVGHYWVQNGETDLLPPYSDSLRDDPNYPEEIAIRITDVPGLGFVIDRDSLVIKHLYAFGREVSVPDGLVYRGDLNFFNIGRTDDGTILIAAEDYADAPRGGGFILINSVDETFVPSSDEKYVYTLLVENGKIAFSRTNMAYVGVQAIQGWLDRYVSEGDFYRDHGTVSMEDGKAVFEPGQMLTVNDLTRLYHTNTATFAEFIYNEVKAIGMTDEELQKYPKLLEAMK